MRGVPVQSLAAAALALALAAATAGCASSGPEPTTSVPANGAKTAPSERALSDDLFPCDARSSPFVLAGGGACALRVEPSDGGAVLWMERGAARRRMDVLRTGEGFVFSGGPGTETELIRFGAAPGAEWTSGAARVRFDGWERLTLPGGTFDAARIRSVSGPASLEVVETWWFAPGAGLVRLRSDKGGVFAEEMTISR